MQQGKSNSTASMMHHASIMGTTNLHSHGIRDSLGARNQEDAQNVYRGGDNIFYQLPGKATQHSLPAVETFRTHLPNDHLPGLYWYHPHHHGSTTFQAGTSSGLIIVEDDSVWLPDKNNCTAVRNTMAAVADVFLHIELLNFGEPEAASAFKPPRDPIYDANYQIMTSEGNVSLCCNSTGLPGAHDNRKGTGKLRGTLSNQNVALINGGYQPIISMKSNEWQRWRMLHSGFKRFMDLQIFDNDSGQVTNECDMMLLAKDGVYLMEIPRPITNVVLSSGSRSEILVRCRGKVGKKFTIQSGRQPPSLDFSIGPAATLFLAHNQSTVATIEIEAGKGKNHAALKPRSCTPLRPSYAADLRNESLAAADAFNKVFYDRRPNFYPNAANTGCTIGNKSFTFPDSNPLRVPLGKIVEWRFNLFLHPLHEHISPFQIQELPAANLRKNCSYTSYFEAGDFHDTLQLPMTMKSTTLRFQPGPFSGYSVAHCHFLHHEDNGCMRVLFAECPGSVPNDQPEVCSNFVFPVKGTFKN